MKQSGVFELLYSQLVFVNELLTDKTFCGSTVDEGIHGHTLHGCVVHEQDLEGVLSREKDIEGE